MDYNALLRQLTIDLITGEPNEILDWFNDMWDQLDMVKKDVYNQDGEEIVYYKKNGYHFIWIFYYDPIRNYFYCDFEHYWSKFPFGGYAQTVAITKLLIESKLNIIIPEPQYATFDASEEMDKMFASL